MSWLSGSVRRVAGALHRAWSSRGGKARHLRVSVVVPAFNSEPYIEARLASIFDQRWPVHQVIVIDDASSDGTVALLQRLNGMSGRRFEIHRSERNTGSPFGQWERALALCTGDLVWIAEADDLADPRFLATVVPPFGSSRCGVSCSNTSLIDAAGAIVAADARRFLSNPHRGLFGSAFLVDGPWFAGNLLAVENCLPNVSAVVFRTTTLRAALARCRDMLGELSLTGDWLLYAEYLRDSDIAFSPKRLNHCRRHSESHTHGLHPMRHYLEVQRLQRHVQMAFPGDETRIAAAAALLTALASHLRIEPGLAPPAGD